MANSITCPSCQTEIEINEVLRSQLTMQIRTELEADVAVKQAELADAKKLIEQERAAVEAARNSVDEQVCAGIEAQRGKLVAEAHQKAVDDLTVEMQDREQRVDELQKKLKESQANELELRKHERELESQKEELQLEVARQLDSERDKIRSEAKQLYEEQHHLKNAEKEKQISDLCKQIDALKRKAEQGSQQLQGEVMELALEDLLTTSFPIDSIEPIGKGVRGGDVLQGVLDCTGLNCGRILWESKRTKNWSNGWLAKARDDQRAARAGCVVIVSEALPEGVRTFALIDGVWVCSWSCVAGLAAALRVGLIEVGKSKLAVQGQHEKMELVYNYLAGRESKALSKRSLRCRPISNLKNAQCSASGRSGKSSSNEPSATPPASMAICKESSARRCLRLKVSDYQSWSMSSRAARRTNLKMIQFSMRPR